jgi:hypothetical protein
LRVQVVARLDVHVSVAELPLGIVMGPLSKLALMSGAGGFACEQDALVPPAVPLQFHVHVLAPLTLLALIPALQL